MITRTPPSPDALKKIRSVIHEWLTRENPHYIINREESRTEPQIACIIRRLQSRSLSPDIRHPVRETPLIAAALKVLPQELSTPLVCAILQLGGNPMIPIKTLDPEKPAYCLHTMLLTPKKYYKPLIQLILSYGFDRNVFQSMMDKIKETGAIKALPENATSIDERYFTVATLIQDAKSAMKNEEPQEAVNYFSKAKELFYCLAKEEENACIQADYTLRATHCQEKIDECDINLNAEKNENQPLIKRPFSLSN